MARVSLGFARFRCRHSDKVPQRRISMPPFGSQQRFAVYHARDIWAMLSPHKDRWLLNQALHYRHVADVQAQQLEQVFTLTNHQEDNWTSRAQIIWHATDAPVRLTSIGDVIVSSQTGQVWLVLPAGFKAIVSPPPDT